MRITLVRLQFLLLLISSIVLLFSCKSETDMGKAKGKKGEEIPPFGRIVAIADVFDALSSPRVYKEPWAESRVLETLKEESGKQFDPEMIDAFQKIKETGKDRIIVILPEGGSKGKKESEVEYLVNRHRMILVKSGQVVKKGELLTDGSAMIEELFRYGGREAAERYIIREINKPYELQGESVSRKHIEVIIRQMFSRRKVKNAGGTALSAGDIVDTFVLFRENEKAKEVGEPEAKTVPVVMGITEVSLSKKSFLAAASFQHTTRVLIDSAIRGKEDELVGLMENVIIGRLIPAGTGIEGSPKAEKIHQLQSNFNAKPFAEEK